MTGTTDEILYQARVHPEQRCNTLSAENLEMLHHQTVNVCQTAVAVDADDSKFPEHWLFKHRWASLLLPQSTNMSLTLSPDHTGERQEAKTYLETGQSLYLILEYNC